MSYAKDIIKRARKNIIDHIHYEIGLIDLAVNAHHDADEEPYTSEEDWLYNPVVEVATDNTYLDVEDYTSETRKVVKISTFGQGIIAETEEGDEICGENIDIDYLVGISDCLDDSYKHLVHK